jgi:transposase, IS6 family
VQPVDFLLSATRDAQAAERFFRKALRAQHTATPWVITVDQNPAYPPAFEALQQAGDLPDNCTLRQCKYLERFSLGCRAPVHAKRQPAKENSRLIPYICLGTALNNVVEHEHSFVKRRVNSGLGFGSFRTAQRTLQGYEAMHMIRKGQIEGLATGDVLAQNRVMAQVFGVAA